MRLAGGALAVHIKDTLDLQRQVAGGQHHQRPQPPNHALPKALHHWQHVSQGFAAREVRQAAGGGGGVSL